MEQRCREGDMRRTTGVVLFEGDADVENPMRVRAFLGTPDLRGPMQSVDIVYQAHQACLGRISLEVPRFCGNAS